MCPLLPPIIGPVRRGLPELRQAREQGPQILLGLGPILAKRLRSCDRTVGMRTPRSAAISSTERPTTSNDAISTSASERPEQRLEHRMSEGCAGRRRLQGDQRKPGGRSRLGVGAAGKSAQEAPCRLFPSGASEPIFSDRLPNSLFTRGASLVKSMT